jgi:hypothetical protein
MNQRAKDGLYQLLERTPVDGRSKMKMGTKVMEKTPGTTTKCCYSCEEEGHLSMNCSKKRERLPTTIVEYEVRYLLALERPKKKKKKKQDYIKVLCFHCREQGHFADQCPERNNKENRQGSVKDLSMITCYKCKQKGHYAGKCTEESTSRLQ